MIPAPTTPDIQFPKIPAPRTTEWLGPFIDQENAQAALLKAGTVAPSNQDPHGHHPHPIPDPR